MPLVACGSSATLTHRNGALTEAKITGGSPEAIIVESDAGLSYAIPRSDIHEIDHPGNVAATIGGAVLGYGLLNIGLALDECQKDERFESGAEQAGFCTGVFSPAVVGLGLLIYGLYTHHRSTSAVDDTSFPSASAARLAPPGDYQPPPDWALPPPAPHGTQP